MHSELLFLHKKNQLKANHRYIYTTAALRGQISLKKKTKKKRNYENCSITAAAAEAT